MSLIMDDKNPDKHTFTLSSHSVFDQTADSANMTSVFRGLLKTTVADIMAALSRRFFSEVEIALSVLDTLALLQ